MTSTGLAVRVWNGTEIARRSDDGYVNATAMCQANGKRFHDYVRLERTQDYIAALAAVTGNPATESEAAPLVDVRQGGAPQEQGTWIHPRLAVDLARWISPQFAVWMDGWFLESLQPEPQSALSSATCNHEHVVAALYHALASLDPTASVDPTQWHVQPTKRGSLYAMHNSSTHYQRHDTAMAAAHASCSSLAATKAPKQPSVEQAIEKLTAYVRLTNNRIVSAYDAQRLLLLDRFMTLHECQSFLCWLAEQRRVGVMVTTPKYKRPCLCLTTY